jgi:hypothetical protein
MVVVVALVTGVSTLSKYSYAPSYVLRFVEPERDAGATPRPRRELADYVRQAVFSAGPLAEVIRRNDLYPGLARKNPHAALQSFREDIDVEVSQNYFVEMRRVGAAPRSARLRLSYHSSDPDLATRITRELGALIVEHETSLLREHAARAAKRALLEVEGARAVLVARRSEVALSRDEIAGGPAATPRQQVELVGLLGSLEALEKRYDESERREAALALDAALEHRGIGMSFTVVDDASPSSETNARNERAVLTLIALVMGLPLATMLVGATARRKGNA